jgi:EpsI family protein
MAQAQKHGWLIVILLVLTGVMNAGISKFRSPEAQPAPKLGELPHRIAGWESRGEIEISQVVLNILRPDAWISRRYEEPSGKPVFLFAQFHSTNRWGAHQPEVCFTSQGWRIEYEKLASTVERNLPGTDVSVNRFLAHKGNERQLVLYWWFSSSNYQTASRTAQMLVTLGREAEDEERLKGFAAKLVPLLGEIIEARPPASS